MKSKLALWSWILPIISIVLGFILAVLAGERVYLAFVIILISYLGSILGLIFGIIALRQISQNPKLMGKRHAIVGIILSAFLILLPLLNLLGLGKLLFD